MQQKKRLFLGANWKMNPAPRGCDSAQSPYRSSKNVDVIVFPSALDIHACLRAGLQVGGQYGRPEMYGAMTGDQNMQMLKDAGCTYVLCGHSERRIHHKETDEDVALQASSALNAGLLPIVCIGETEAEHRAGHAKKRVLQQLSTIPEGVTLIAYEPIWAIGTGVTPTPAEAEEIHTLLRTARGDATCRFIYGGSLNALNATEFLSQPNIDGSLIGGASLKPDEFRKIVEIAIAI